MCYSLAPGESEVPNIAKEDFKVYKVVSRLSWRKHWKAAELVVKARLHRKRVYKSALMDYIYVSGIEQPTVKLELDIAHSMANFGGYNNSLPPYKLVHKGYHSYCAARTAELKRCTDEVVVECTVPKGAKYFCNDFECVSSDITVDKVIKIKTT